MVDSLKNKKLIEFSDPVSEIKEKFDFYIKIVVYILVAAIVTMLIMVGTLVVDSFHFNSAIYREQTTKVEDFNKLLEENMALLESSKKNQEIIIKNQDILNNYLKTNKK